MRRTLAIGVSAALAAASLTAALATSHGASSASAEVKSKIPSNATTRIAGLQHFCGSNGITCAEPATVWDELAGYDKAVKAGARILPYIGHDEPATLFYSNKPGAGNNVTYQLTLPGIRPPGPSRTAVAGHSASSCTRRSGSAW
jgi:Flp pilus assembly protein TadG